MAARSRPRTIQPRRLETRLSYSSQSPAVQFHEDNITEVEARKRLSSYVVVRVEKSPSTIDDEGNLAPPTWEKASHMIQRDISQQEAKYKVHELNQETGSVLDKKHELSSALQRRLERAHVWLEKMESDRRYVYTLVQLDWTFKRVETPREYYARHGKPSKDKKTTKERHRSRPKKERLSVTAYFKREPSNNENWLKMYNHQQSDKKGDGSQLKSSGMARQDTSGSQNSRSSATSFSSFSSEDSNGVPTPNSSVDDISPHRQYEEGRGRSRYRQSRNREHFEIVVARPQRECDSVRRHDYIPPPVPDPTRPEPKPVTDSLRSMEQRACGEGRSRSVRDSPRQPRLTQSPLEKQSISLHRVPYYALSGEDVDQLGDGLSRASLADAPKSSRQEPASGAATAHYTYRPLRQCRGDGDEELLVSEPNDIVWRKQDAQRYMDNKRRFDQDAWDLGRRSPLLYADGGGEYR
ncbi:uncharacterized protein TrAFT101_009979 [Trichoderma asperellum]|uniref:Uncharacterized protein n=1 Tax=Trichoderma asperellum (strain ATCC 204424 / CBS 433.97 / NBRC 101777) TaxID=1042311 RepID=A0A2T3Z9C7_TRIA4|nr:hypothetical protein M441DRAFT_138309 [Trichoderma asperellum CBS 433.97]PTB41414.1 hypothetical protein M441DRAFT_138309 [Trichoderma asperellum CBS 433.97]UKZ95126.1 hypothetical protein TrAFT101_009979 [Trichoderma asperellum]